MSDNNYNRRESLNFFDHWLALASLNAVDQNIDRRNNYLINEYGWGMMIDRINPIILRRFVSYRSVENLVLTK